MALTYSPEIVNGRLNLVLQSAGDGALITIYRGTRPEPGGPPTNALAVLTCGTPFAPAPENGVLIANPIVGEATDSGSNPTWFRLASSGGVFVMDGDVGTSLESDFVVSSNVFIEGGKVEVVEFILTGAS